MGITLGIFIAFALAMHAYEPPPIVCTIVNATLSTVENLQFTPDPEYFGPMYPPSALRALLYIPLVSTNLVATALICYKAWYVVR